MRTIVIGLFATLLFTASQAHALDRTIRLVNATEDDTVVAFYASNVGRGIWERDILGTDELGPGDTARIDLDDGSGYCRFDFKTVMESGAVMYRWGVDACDLVSYRIVD